MLNNTSTSDTSSQRLRAVEYRHAGVCIRHEEVLIVEESLKDFELEAWGEGELAYIKHLKAKDVAELFPQLGGLPEGIDLYAVVSADGTPMVLTDSRSAALENVEESDLELVTLH
jgi:hypothetical protein